MKNSKSYSRIIAGTMTWGSWGKKLSRNEMVDLMHHCVELGISTFDHADIYGAYGNEEEFGNAYKESGIEREKIQLISKCGIQYICEGRDNVTKHYNYTSDYIIWSAERSIKKLGTDHLDLFLLHRPSPLMEPNEILRGIDHLISSGKIKQFGVSNFTPSQIAMIETVIPITANQVECSITAEGVFYDGTLDDCITHNRTAMAWSPTGSYFRDKNEQTARIRKVVQSFEQKYGANENELIMAWLLRHPARIHPVVGTTNKERLKDAMNATKIDLELEDWFTLLTASQGHKVP